MSEKDSLNFYKLSTLLLDVGNHVLRKRIEEECARKGTDFEAFLNLATTKDTLFHLWQPHKCCIPYCSTITHKQILQKAQWELLYANNGGTITGHVKRNASGKTCQACSCGYIAFSGICTDVLDVTLSTLILTSVCTLTPVEKISVETLRGLRNSVFAHATTAKVSDPDFNLHWQNIECQLTTIASFCNNSVKQILQEKIGRLKDLPFIDCVSIQTLLCETQRLRGLESRIFEVLQDMKTVSDPCNPGNNNKRITEVEVESFRPTDFLETRALFAGITLLKQKGIVIYTGMSGSGKTRNSKEILRRVKAGVVFGDEHDIQHIDIENFDFQVNVDLNTVVYLEDQLGKVNANKELILNDKGKFDKIWACIQTGKIKVIMTIRTNILNEFIGNLNDYKLFDGQNIVDLSNGEFILTQEEKENLVQLHCKRNRIEIIADTNTDVTQGAFGDGKPIQISAGTVQKIIRVETPIGFPLCCNYFFKENTKNISLGERFFSQPTQYVLDEIKGLALSEDISFRQRFAVLLYMVLNNGRLDSHNISDQIFSDIAKELHIPTMDNFYIRTALRTMKNKYILCEDKDDIRFKIYHTTILEAVLIICGRELYKLIPLILSNCDIKTVCECVRTEGSHVEENEIVCRITKSHYPALAERFVAELKQRNIGVFVMHSSLDDEIFLSVFKNILQNKENKGVIHSENDDGYSLFNLACLYNRTNLIKHMLPVVPSVIIREGCLMGIKFNSIDTVSILLNKMSTEHTREAFENSCNNGTIAMIKLTIDHAKEDLLPANKQRGLMALCRRKNAVEGLKTLLKCGFDTGIYTGLTEACRYGNIACIEILMQHCGLFTEDQLIKACLKAVEYSQEDVIRLLFGYMTDDHIHQSIVMACKIGNRKLLTNLLRSEMFLSNDNITKCLISICKRQELFCNVPYKKKGICSVPNNVPTPFPVSVRDISSVHIQTPATENINLLPRFNFSEFCTLTEGNVTSPNQSNGFLVQSILQYSSSLENEQIGRFLAIASQYGQTEIAYVILEHTKILPKQYIEDAAIIALKHCHLNTLSFLLSNLDINHEIGIGVEEINEDEADGYLEIIFESQERNPNSTKLLGYIFGRLHYLHVDIVQKCLERSYSKGHLRIYSNLITNANLEYETLREMVKRECNKDTTNILEILMATHHELEKIDIFAFLRIVVSNNNFDAFKIIIRSQACVDLNEIKHVLSQPFIQSNFYDLFDLFTTLRPDMTSESVKRTFLNIANISNQYEFERRSLISLVLQNEIDTVKETLQQKKYISKETVIEIFKLACFEKRNAKMIPIILKERTDIPTYEIYQCLFTLCSKHLYGSDIIKEIILSKTDLTSEQIYQCLYQICVNPDCNSSDVNEILMHRSDLTTEQVYECLLVLCSKHHCSGDVIKEFITKRLDLTTEQIQKCLCTLCSESDFEPHVLNSFLDIRSDMKTEHVFECLLQLCSNRKCCFDNVITFLNKRSDLTVEHVLQCLLQLRPDYKYRYDDISQLLEHRPNITHERFYQIDIVVTRALSF